MSEYQYYEFRAVDRPLTPEQMSELRALSSRAEITSNSFTNSYNYGDFRGDPRKLMETYFDAHVYVSNFGTFTFLLRLPRAVLPDDTLARYASEEALNWWTTDEHTILEWQLNEDSSDGWMEGKGWMSRLLPLRDELVRGDYRSLYIGWLSSLWDGSLEDDEEDSDDWDDDDAEEPEDEEDDRSTGRREPPVPAGLGALTAAQSALAEFLCVDSDLMAVAAAASPKAPSNANSAQKAAEWVARLSEQEVRSLVGRVLNGEGMRVQAELQSQYYRADGEAAANSEAKAHRNGRTVAELLTMAAQAESERERKQTEERDRKRHAYLTGLATRFAELWSKVNTLAEEQKPASYDQACTLLVDMRDAYAHTERRPEFDTEFARFLGQFSRRTALVRKLKEVGFTS